jgi:hypothetical protein
MSDWEVADTSIQEYVGEVIESKFVVNEMNGRPMLTLKHFTDNADLPEWTERYNLGQTAKGGFWIVMEDGASVVADDLSDNFRANSGYGYFIQAAAKIIRVAGLNTWGSTKRAETWLGCKWQMQAKVVSSWKDRETGEDRTWTLRLPVTWLGRVGGEPNQQMSFDDAVVALLTDGQKSRLKELAGRFGFDDWKYEVMDEAGKDGSVLSGLLGNDKVMTELGKGPGLYQAIKG